MDLIVPNAIILIFLGNLFFVNNIDRFFCSFGNALFGDVEVILVLLDANKFAASIHASYASRAATHDVIKYNIAFIGIGFDQVLKRKCTNRIHAKLKIIIISKHI